MFDHEDSDYVTVCLLCNKVARKKALEAPFVALLLHSVYEASEQQQTGSSYAAETLRTSSA
jgi:hypothetical protein